MNACGAGGGQNLMYPLPNGQMRSDGWSLSENALKPKAMFKELMGYCRPRWISDFIYERFEQRVRMLSSMAMQPPAPPRLRNVRCWATWARVSARTGASWPSG